MFKILSLVLVTVFSISPTFCQYNYINDYFKNTSESKYQLYSGNTDSALYFLDKAFAKAPYRYAFDKIIYAECLYRKGKVKECFSYLKEGIEDGFSLYFIDSSEFADIFRNSSMRDMLASSDQKFRKSLSDSRREYYDSCMYYMYNEKALNAQDNDKFLLATKQAKKYIDSSLQSHEQVEMRFMNYVVNNGWVSYRRAGAGGALLACAAHLSEERLQKLIPFLYEELKKGFINPDEYAFIAEKLYMANEQNSYRCHFKPMGYQCSTLDWPFILDNRSKIGMSIYLDGDDYVNSDWNKRTLLNEQ